MPIRVLHEGSNLQSVGLMIDQEATNITEFEFLRLEREWDELTSAVQVARLKRKRQQQRYLLQQQQHESSFLGNSRINNKDADKNSKKTTALGSSVRPPNNINTESASSGKTPKNNSSNAENEASVSSGDDEEDDENNIKSPTNKGSSKNNTANPVKGLPPTSPNNITASTEEDLFEDKAVRHTIAGATTTSLRFYEVTAESVGRKLEPISITEIIDHTFGGIEITRDLLNRVAYSQKPVTSYFPSVYYRLARSNNNNTDLITFHEFLYAVFPRVPSLNIDRFFMTYLTEELLLGLKGSLGIPPYVRFAPTSKPTAVGTFAHTKEPNTRHEPRTATKQKNSKNGSSSSSSPRTRSGAGAAAHNGSSDQKQLASLSQEKVHRLEVVGPSFEEMAGVVGGRLDIVTLSSNNFCVGPMLFPEELFDAVSSRFAPRGTNSKDVSGWRATFFECLRILFPRIPETLLKCYEVTTPSVPLLQGMRDIFVLRNPSAFKQPPVNPSSSAQQEGGGSSQQQQQQQDKGGINEKFRGNALLKKNSSKDGNNNNNNNTQESEDDKNRKMIDLAVAKKAKRDTANTFFLPQVLPSGTIQCVGGEPCKSVQEMVNIIVNGNNNNANNLSNNFNNNFGEQQTQQQQNQQKVGAKNDKNSNNKAKQNPNRDAAGNKQGSSNQTNQQQQQQQANQNTTSSDFSNPVAVLFPADRQWLSLNDYKTLIFETKRYSDFTTGVPLTYNIFVTIEKSFKVDTQADSSAVGKKNNNASSQKRNRRGGDDANGLRISLASAIRFLYPNGPLPLFMAYIDRMEKVLGAPSTKFVLKSAAGTSSQGNTNENNNNNTKTDFENNNAFDDSSAHKFLSIAEQQQRQEARLKDERQKQAIQSLLKSNLLASAPLTASPPTNPKPSAASPNSRIVNANKNTANNLMNGGAGIAISPSMVHVFTEEYENNINIKHHQHESNPSVVAILPNSLESEMLQQQKIQIAKIVSNQQKRQHQEQQGVVSTPQQHNTTNSFGRATSAAVGAVSTRASPRHGAQRSPNDNQNGLLHSNNTTYYSLPTTTTTASPRKQNGNPQLSFFEMQNALLFRNPNIGATQNHLHNTDNCGGSVNFMNHNEHNNNNNYDPNEMSMMGFFNFNNSTTSIANNNNNNNNTSTPHPSSLSTAKHNNTTSGQLASPSPPKQAKRTNSSFRPSTTTTITASRNYPSSPTKSINFGQNFAAQMASSANSTMRQRSSPPPSPSPGKRDGSGSGRRAGSRSRNNRSDNHNHQQQHDAHAALQRESSFHKRIQQEQNELSQLQKQQEKNNPTMIRLANGLYCAKDIAKDFAILDAHDKAVQNLEKQRREKLQQQKAKLLAKRGGGGSGNGAGTNGANPGNNNGPVVIPDNQGDIFTRATNNDNSSASKQNNITQELRNNNNNNNNNSVVNNNNNDVDDDTDDEEHFLEENANNIPNFHQHHGIDTLESVSHALVKKYYEYNRIKDNEFDRRKVVNEVKNKLQQEQEELRRQQQEQWLLENGGGMKASMNMSMNASKRLAQRKSFHGVSDHMSPSNSMRSMNSSRTTAPGSVVAGDGRSASGKPPRSASPPSSSVRASNANSNNTTTKNNINSSNKIPTTTTMTTMPQKEDDSNTKNSGNGINHINGNIADPQLLLHPEQVERMLRDILGSDEQAQAVIAGLKRQAASTVLPPQVLSSVAIAAAAHVDKQGKMREAHEAKQKSQFGLASNNQSRGGRNNNNNKTAMKK